jgi:Zn2+/Cd2+-exporting ATPase
MINTDPNHKHTYDAQGNMTCCSLEEKVYKNAHAAGLLKPITDSHEEHDHASKATESHAWKTYLPAGISFTLLMIGLVIDYFFKLAFFQAYTRLAWYTLAYLPVRS